MVQKGRPTPCSPFHAKFPFRTNMPSQKNFVPFTDESSLPYWSENAPARNSVLFKFGTPSGMTLASLNEKIRGLRRRIMVRKEENARLLRDLKMAEAENTRLRRELELALEKGYETSPDAKDVSLDTNDISLDTKELHEEILARKASVEKSANSRWRRFFRLC